MRQKTVFMLLGLLSSLILAACGPTVGPEGTPVAGTPRPAPTDTPPPGSREPPAACQGQIAFLARPSGPVDIFVIHADGRGLAHVTDDPASEQYPAWSPDGTQLTFAAMRDGRIDLYLINADGSGLTKLVDLGGREYQPSWSPDGKQILFAATIGYGSEVFVVDVASGKVTQLTETVGHKTEPAWSPDGTRISFTQLDSFNQGDVWVMNADGSGMTNLTANPAHDCCAVWSPEGKQLAFLSSRADQGAGLLPSGRNSAYLLASRLVRADHGGDPLAPSNVVRALTTVLPERPRGIYLMNDDGSGLRNLTSGAGYEKDPAWSPDGRWIAFVSDRDGNDEIYVMAVPAGTEADGSGPTRLTNDPRDDWYPAWSPTGGCIAFLSRSNDDYGIYLMNPNGSELWRLADSAIRSLGPVWAPY